MNWDIEFSPSNPFQTYGRFSIAFQEDVFPAKTFLPIDAILK